MFSKALVELEIVSSSTLNICQKFTEQFISHQHYRNSMTPPLSPRTMYAHLWLNCLPNPLPRQGLVILSQEGGNAAVSFLQLWKESSVPGIRGESMWSVFKQLYLHGYDEVHLAFKAF